MRSASRLTTSGSSSPSSVSASRPRAPTGVFSSWLMLATKSRRTASSRLPFGDVVDQHDGSGVVVAQRGRREHEGAPGWPGLSSRCGRMSMRVGERLGEQLFDRRLDDSLRAATAGVHTGRSVAVRHRASVVEHQHTEGQRIDGVAHTCFGEHGFLPRWPGPRRGSCAARDALPLPVHHEHGRQQDHQRRRPLRTRSS